MLAQLKELARQNGIQPPADMETADLLEELAEQLENMDEAEKEALAQALAQMSAQAAQSGIPTFPRRWQSFRRQPIRGISGSPERCQKGFRRVERCTEEYGSAGSGRPDAFRITSQPPGAGKRCRPNAGEYFLSG